MTSRTRRLLHSAAAVALVLPVSVAAVAVPAEAATHRPVLADRGSGYGYGPGYGDAPPSYSSSASLTAGLDTSVATSTQSTGLVEVTSTLADGEAAGTGIVLSSDGLVVTNHHVVEGATSVEVTDATTGATYDADVLGWDAAKDVAVLHLEDASGLTAVTTATDPATVGEAVTAIGDAGGDGGSLTAAPGTVTALRHTIQVGDETTGATTTLRRLIEVSSDIVSGDSGGALLDADGEVLGMNVAASSGTADVTGYVIPIARVLKVVDQVESGLSTGTTTGHVVVGLPAYLGVALDPRYSAPTLAGVLADGPAAELGLTAGETITSIDGTPVSTADELRAAVTAHEPGDQVTVTWTTVTGASESGTTTLAEGPVS